MTISMMRAKERIQDMKETGVDANSLGFVATVLRDNELDDDLHAFYQLVMDYVDEVEKQEAVREKAMRKAEQAQRKKEQAKEKADEKKKNSL